KAIGSWMNGKCEGAQRILCSACGLKSRLVWQRPGTLIGAKHRLDVDDGRAVNGFYGSNAQAILNDLANDHAMKADGVGTVGRAGGKYAVEALLGIGAGIDL